MKRFTSFTSWWGLAVVVALLLLLRPVIDEVGLSFPLPFDGNAEIKIDIDKVDEFLAFEKRGTDERGNSATFDFVVLYGVNGDYRWKFASDKEIYNEDTKSYLDAKDLFRGEFGESNIRERIGKALDVISVGVASCEGGQFVEEERAQNRAEVLRSSVEKVSEASATYRILQLGQYQDLNCSMKTREQTRLQRSILIITAFDKDSGINLLEALRNVMDSASKDEVLKRELEEYLNGEDRFALEDLDPAKYTKFELEGFDNSSE